MNVFLISLQESLNAIGLKCLHYHLLRNGYHSVILYLPTFNMHNNTYLENIRKFVFEINPGFIGISLMSNEYYAACYLTKYLKDSFKRAPVIWGGVHPTIWPESCVDYADYVCVGEGERTILDIANAVDRNKDIASINNLCYMEDGNLKKNSLYPLVENLDEISSCEYIPVNSFLLTNRGVLAVNKKIFRRYNHHLGATYSIMTSRGCYFSCTYCCNNTLSRLYHSRKVRKRTLLNVVEELERAIKNNPEIEYINFFDDCFLIHSEEYLREFSLAYKERIRKQFIIRCIPINVTWSKINSLKHAGVAWINMGLQSGSDRINKQVYRRESFTADFLKAAKIIRDFNIAANYDVILDNPFEKEADKIATVKALIKTPKPFYPQFFSLTLYYGTDLYEEVKLNYPDQIGDSLLKDCWLSEKNTINNIIKLTPFINKKFMIKFVRLYKKYPKSIKFNFFLYILNLASMLVFVPVTYFQTIRLSQRGAYLKTFKLFMNYFDEGIKRYIKQFVR